MKKLVFMLVAFAAVSFASCGNKTENAGTNDSDSAAQMTDTTVKDYLDTFTVGALNGSATD
ncbi:MAG: hypothetical protein ACFNO3_06150, partial [Alloprevotella tannerae]